jgi:hypothetical protein
MSMTQPLEPELPPERDGIPAADAGPGAPPPAEGFGVRGEEPDRHEQEAEPVDVTLTTATPFRTPDPADIGPNDVSADRSQ